MSILGSDEDEERRLCGDLNQEDVDRLHSLPYSPFYAKPMPYIPWSFASWWNGLEGQDLPFLLDSPMLMALPLEERGAPLPSKREEQEEKEAAVNLLKVERNHSSGPMSYAYKQRRRREACRFSRRKIRFVPKKTSHRKTFRYYTAAAMALSV